MMNYKKLIACAALATVIGMPWVSSAMADDKPAQEAKAAQDLKKFFTVRANCTCNGPGGKCLSFSAAEYTVCAISGQAAIETVRQKLSGDISTQARKAGVSLSVSISYTFTSN